MKKTNKKQKKQFKGSLWIADAIREDRKKGLTYNEIVEKYAQKNIKTSRGYVYQIITNKIWKKIDTQKIEYLSNLIKSGDNSFLQKKIEYLCLPTRASNALKHSEIETIGQLISYSEIDLMGFEKFGKVSVKNIKSRLAYVGLSLKKNY